MDASATFIAPLETPAHGVVHVEAHEPTGVSRSLGALLDADPYEPEPLFVGRGGRVLAALLPVAEWERLVRHDLVVERTRIAELDGRPRPSWSLYAGDDLDADGVTELRERVARATATVRSLEPAVLHAELVRALDRFAADDEDEEPVVFGRAGRPELVLVPVSDWVRLGEYDVAAEQRAQAEIADRVREADRRAGSPAPALSLAEFAEGIGEPMASMVREAMRDAR